MVSLNGHQVEGSQRLRSKSLGDLANYVMIIM